MPDNIPKFVIYTGDTRPVFNFTINKNDGTGVLDLTSASVKCLFRQSGDETNFLTGSNTNGIVTNATAGQCSYTLPSPFTNPGVYLGQVYIDFGGGAVQRSQRFELKVLEGISAQ